MPQDREERLTTITKLLRALAESDHAMENRHDVILCAAADEIDGLRDELAYYKKLEAELSR